MIVRVVVQHMRCLLAWSLFLHVFMPPAMSTPVSSGPDSLSSRAAPVLLEDDTLFTLHASLGPFSPVDRAQAINERLQAIVRAGSFDSVAIAEGEGATTLSSAGIVVMAVTDGDALPAGKNRRELATEFRDIIQTALLRETERYSTRSLLVSAAIAASYLFLLVAFFWLLTKVFPAVYRVLQGWEGRVFRPLTFRTQEILSASGVAAIVVACARGMRLALSLGALYFFIVQTLALFPLTQRWNVRPVLVGIALSILTTAAAVVLLRTFRSLFHLLLRKVDGWKGTVITPVRLKTIEILSEDRIAEVAKAGFRTLSFLSVVTLGYFYITILFSFFSFTQTWAETLFGYIMSPLWRVVTAFVSYLPNLFFILVIAFVTRYVIKFIRLIFTEIGKGTLSFPGFFREWADPTYKIVRFLILAFAGIVIFPYLPGSDSPIFQGVSVFLGILFSLGSTSAISNIVAGVVLTYMRPFTIGDRVKIADTVGDIREKTLLVTRVRTIKNVDITIPNAMVLGSHIMNFSSPARDAGLILHTSVTIGYDVPWRKVHQLLMTAAESVPGVLAEPAPFVLQTSLDDSYVSYELNAYTNEPNAMARTYSSLHQNIQDRFNEAGVEIMSPAYAALRDGNKVTIPSDHLPPAYTPGAFRVASSPDKSE